MGVVVDIAVEHAREEQKGEGAEWGIVGCCAWAVVVVVLWRVLVVWTQQSLNLQTKMKAKMSLKMTIFEEARVGFDFWKMIIFDSFLISFSSSFFWKMEEK